MIMNLFQAQYRRLKYFSSHSGKSTFKKLKMLKNKYLNKKTVILCNGPSLNDVQLDCLTNVYTFGLNKINLIFKTSKFRPSFIIATNKLVIDQNSKFYNSTKIPIFLDYFNAHNLVKYKSNTHFLCTIEKRFSTNPLFGVSQGGTVTFTALQLAKYMGFTQVALVGCDHNYSYQGNPHEEKLFSGNDKNHFHKDYFKDLKWNIPDLKQSEKSYWLAKKIFEKNNSIIYNCTTNTKLNIFPKISLQEFLYKI